jgi:hypothetical protein
MSVSAAVTSAALMGSSERIESAFWMKLGGALYLHTGQRVHAQELDSNGHARGREHDRNCGAPGFSRRTVGEKRDGLNCARTSAS